MSLPQGASDARRVGGGDINEAFRVRLRGSEAFVKTRPDAGEGEYALEAAGLGWLAEPGALRTPGVIEVADDYLALEWVEPGNLSEAGAEELGRGLATTHMAGAPRFGDPGFGERLGVQARFGSLRLPNEPSDDWCSFYGERRLLALARIARDRGALSQAGAVAVERVSGRLDDLAGPAEPPARLHGDLWSGNVHADAEGRAWLIDPSAYGGHRELDLAMLRLFGAPSERIFAAYEEQAPLADGWRERVRLWQLLPLLVHAVLFGGSYSSAAEQVAESYAG
ncbi:MAG TPA: fructosamine kinase family protein [Solirubrobacteraceae bacterium]|jgi:fructosamine-3-kinase|nr:fructosamine kinase family protein [Solirubrobacteraceae bacterium]